MNNTNITLYFSKFFGITVTIRTDYLVIVNIVGNVLTIPSDAFLLLQFIRVHLAPKLMAILPTKKSI